MVAIAIIKCVICLPFFLLKSSQIPYSAFEGNWIGASVSYQRSLLFVMLRSTTVQKLTALKFSIVSLASYSKVGGELFPVWV